jgi:hypothetical protein
MLAARLEPLKAALPGPQQAGAINRIISLLRNGDEGQAGQMLRVHFCGLDPYKSEPFLRVCTAFRQRGVNKPDYAKPAPLSAFAEVLAATAPKPGALQVNGNAQSPHEQVEECHKCDAAAEAAFAAARTCVASDCIVPVLAALNIQQTCAKIQLTGFARGRGPRPVNEIWYGTLARDAFATALGSYTQNLPTTKTCMQSKDPARRCLASASAAVPESEPGPGRRPRLVETPQERLRRKHLASKQASAPSTGTVVSWDAYVVAQRAALKDYRKLLVHFPGLEATIRAEIAALETAETERRKSCVVGDGELLEPEKYYAANGCSGATLATSYWQAFSKKYQDRYQAQEAAKAEKAAAAAAAVAAKEKMEKEQNEKLAAERRATTEKLRAEKLASRACKVAQARHEMCTVLFGYAQVLRAIAYQKRLNDASGTVNPAKIRQLTASRLAYHDMMLAKDKVLRSLKAPSPKGCDQDTGVAKHKAEQDAACLLE